MKISYNALRTRLEAPLGVGPLTYLGSTITESTGPRGLLTFYAERVEGNVRIGEFRLAIALITSSMSGTVTLLDTTLAALRGVFNGRVNQACLLGEGGMATLGDILVSEFEGVASNATRSTVDAVKCYIGATIVVRNLA